MSRSDTCSERGRRRSSSGRSAVRTAVAALVLERTHRLLDLTEGEPLEDIHVSTPTGVIRMDMPPWSTVADLEKAAQGVFNAAFGFSGQKCSACSRLYLHESIKDKWRDF